MDSLLDQDVGPGDVSLAKINETVEYVVYAARDDQSDSPIIAAVHNLRTRMQYHGLILAELLYEWREHTEEFGVSKEDWADHVFESTGISPQTSRKYTSVWETVFKNPNVPQSVIPALIDKPMQGLLLLPAAVKEDQLGEDDWRKIAEAPDPLTIREVIRSIRGEKTSSPLALRLGLARDGTIWAYRGDYAVPCGYLNNHLDNLGGDLAEIVEAAVSRITRSSGILEE